MKEVKFKNGSFIKILKMNEQRNQIDTNRLRRVESSMLLPPKEEVENISIPEHKSEPIKSIDDINRITEYLTEQERWRDNMFFVVGINFGLRVSDLLRLRFCDLINEDLTFKTSFPILEQKTSKTRKTQKNRWVTINDAVIDAVLLYLEHKPASLSDYLFRSEGNRGRNLNQPMSRMTADRILKNIATQVGIDIHMSTHTLRKTFGYHQMLMSDNDPRKLLLLQKIFGHSTVLQTLDYIGFTAEEIEDAYKKLNLGLKSVETKERLMYK